MIKTFETSETLRDELPYPEIDIEPGLRLKQLDLNQADQIFNIIDKSREYLEKWLPWVNHTISADDSRNFIKSTIEKRKNGEEYGYGIEVDGIVMGHTSIMHLKDNKDPEIGYWIVREASGKGITTKAASALTDFSFNELGLKKIIIRARPDNVGSNKVAEKLGYKNTHQMNDEAGVLLNVWELLAP